MILKPLDHIAMPAQLLLSVKTPADGHAVSVTIDGVVFVFEFNSVGSVASGRFAIGIGGSEAATAMNAAAVLSTVIGGWVYIAVDGAYVDVRAKSPETAMSANTVLGTSEFGQVNPAQRSLPTILMLMNRTVFPIDVTRGKMVVLPLIDNLAVVVARFQVSATNSNTVAWTGQVTIPSTGRVELINAGATPYAISNVLQLLMTGDRYE